MSNGARTPADEKHRANFVALVLLLRELAQGLLVDGRAAEARGLIDSIEALKVKTKGNLSEEETRFLEDVLYGLHLAAVKAPEKAPEKAAGEVAGEPNATTPGSEPEPQGQAQP
jgi:hypothetical protein